MTLTSKEHYELIEMFEREFKGEFRMDKEDKSMWAKGAIYQNDTANLIFKAYRRGVAYGKATA